MSTLSETADNCPGSVWFEALRDQKSGGGNPSENGTRIPPYDTPPPALYLACGPGRVMLPFCFPGFYSQETGGGIHIISGPVCDVFYVASAMTGDPPSSQGGTPARQQLFFQPRTFLPRLVFCIWAEGRLGANGFFAFRSAKMGQKLAKKGRKRAGRDVFGFIFVA